MLPTCLAEIDRARPYFIGMHGERCGWILPPEGFAPGLIGLLDAEFPASSVPDAFEREAMRHEAYATPRRRL